MSDMLEVAGGADHRLVDLTASLTSKQLTASLTLLR